MNRKLHRALRVGKPVNTLNRGFAFSLQSNFVPPPHGAGLFTVADFAGTRGLVLSVLSYHKGASHVWGTAVMVAPGVALSALHVFDEIRGAGHLSGGTSDIYLLGVIDARALMWRVRSIHGVGNSDAVAVTVELYSRWPKPRRLDVAHLTTRIPQVGELVSIAGYRAGDVAFPDAHSKGGATIPMLLLSSVGTVSAVYPEGRDRVMLPQPCFEIQAKSLGGMSGGPIFDQSGRLCGVLTSSFGDEPPSYGSLWWPVAGAPLQPYWPRGFYGEKPTLLSISREVAGRPAGSFIHEPERLHVWNAESTGDVVVSILRQ